MEQIRKAEDRVKSLGGSMGQTAEDKSNREKFEELIAKERDLNNFMEGFPSRKAAKMTVRMGGQKHCVHGMAWHGTRPLLKPPHLHGVSACAGQSRACGKGGNLLPQPHM